MTVAVRSILKRDYVMLTKRDLLNSDPYAGTWRGCMIGLDIRSGSGRRGGKIHGVVGFYKHFGGYNAYIWETYLDHLPQNHT